MTRDKAPQRDLIERTADALRAAGYDVATDIDAAARAAVAIEADFAERAQDREQKYTARAQRHHANSDAAHDRADQLSRRFAGGQPILIGHHSQASAERDHHRIGRQMNKAIDEREAASYAAARARDARAAVRSSANPYTVANRIENLAAEVRKIERRIALADPLARSAHLTRHHEQLAHLQAALTRWQQIREQQIKDGAATNYGPGTVHPGDAVKIAGSWWRVIRANTKSVTVETEYSWNNRAPWHTVQDHRSAAASA